MLSKESVIPTDRSDAKEKETRLEEILKQSPNNNTTTNESFNTVLNAWSDEQAPQRAEHWFQRMLTLNIPPNVDSYNAVIRSWIGTRNNKSNRGEIAIVRAETWLKKLISHNENYDGGDFLSNSSRVYPNTESYNAFLNVLASRLSSSKIKQSARTEYAEKAEQILNTMLSSSESTSDNSGCHDCFPNTQSFQHVMRILILCKGKDDNLPNKIMYWLRFMESHHRDYMTKEEDNIFMERESSPSIISPNTACYSMAIHAWGLAGQKKALAYLKNQQQRQHRHNTSKSNNKMNGYDEIIKSESILEYMHRLRNSGSDVVVPDTKAYNSILGNWAKVSNEVNIDAPLRAERVFRKMSSHKQNHTDDYDDDDFYYHDSSIDTIRTDYTSFGSIIHAWIKTKQDNSATRAHWWLNEMKQQYYLNDSRTNKHNLNTQPITNAYNFVIKAYINEKNPEKADEVFCDLIDFSSSRKNNDHHAHGTNGDDGQNQVDNSQCHSVKPNTDSFLLIIKSWMQYEASGSEPVGRGYRSAYHWLCEAIHREDDQRQQQLKDYPEQEVQVVKDPSSSSSPSSLLSSQTTKIETLPEMYTNVLKAISISKDKSLDSLEIATKTFNRLQQRSREDGLVTSQSYKLFLQIILKVLCNEKERRDQMLEKILEMCFHDGLLSSDVISVLSNGTLYYPGWTKAESRAVTDKIFGDWPLPLAWSRNVKSKPKRQDLVRTVYHMEGART